MKAAGRLALEERRARAVDFRAAQYAPENFRRHLSALTPKPDR